MRKRNMGWAARAALLLLFCGLLSTTVSLAAAAGTNQDPLVTLSSLHETFMDTLMARVDEKIAQRTGQSGTSGTASSFHVVTLSSGQTLTGDIGCEVMLRVGSAVCVSPSSPGLIDESAASTLNSGSALVTKMCIRDRASSAVSTAERTSLASCPITGRS